MAITWIIAEAEARESGAITVDAPRRHRRFGFGEEDMRSVNSIEIREPHRRKERSCCGRLGCDSIGLQAWATTHKQSLEWARPA